MAKTCTPLPQIIPSRVNKTLQDLKKSIWTSEVQIDVEGGPVNDGFIQLADAKKQKLALVKAGDYFGPPNGGWKQRWFKFNLAAAGKEEKGRRALFWVCPGESTFYVDGEPRGGCDAGHHYWPTPDAACEVWVEVGMYNTGIWGMHVANPDQYGLCFHGAFLKLRDADAWNAFYDLETLSKLQEQLRLEIRHDVPGIGYAAPLDKCDPLLRKLLKGLDDAIDSYDLRGAKALSQALVKVYAELKAEPYQIRCSMVGHAHIDLVWLWPESVTVRKGVHTFSGMLGLMDKYPEFVFTMSQPALLNAVKAVEPGLYQRVLSKIKEGKWEATGGMEVEPDTNLPCGEAMARSLLYGQRRLAAFRGGKMSECVWIPDVFGYANYLPQLFSLAGIKYFYTTKMTWSVITKFNHNSFVWRGSDGKSEILTYLHPAGYNGNAEVKEVVDAANSHRQSDVHGELLYPTGYGDGGGGVTEEQIERVRRLADLARTPKAGWSSAEKFFGRLAKVREELPVYQGELYLEYHRGTYTTQSDYKAAYRACERSLQTLEAVRAAIGGKAPGEEAWLRLLFGQFHDALPGSSIALVYNELEPELRALAAKHLAAAAKELSDKATKDESTFSVFNPLPFGRSLVVELPAAGFDGDSAEACDEVIQLQKSGGKILAAIEIGALESMSITASSELFEEDPDLQLKATATGTALSNGIVLAKFDKNGLLCSLKVDENEMLLSGAARFTLHEDHPAMFEEWDIDHSANWLEVDSGVKFQLKVVEDGPVRVSLVGESKLGKDSTVKITYTLNVNESFLRVSASIDWKEKRRLLRYLVPTDYKGRSARFGCGFGSVMRPQLPGDQTDEAMWEVPGNRWAAVTDDNGEGLSIITEAKYGFRCKEGNLSVSLLRSAVGHGTGDQCVHELNWAVGQYCNKSSGFANTAAEADALFTPPVVLPGRLDMDPAFMLLLPGSLVQSWVVPSESGRGLLLRFHEVSGGHGTAILAVPKLKKACIVDLFENVISELECDGDHISIPYTPYCVLGVLVSF